jgi:hypothetical protein
MPITPREEIEVSDFLSDLLTAPEDFRPRDSDLFTVAADGDTRFHVSSSEITFKAGDKEVKLSEILGMIKDLQTQIKRLELLTVQLSDEDKKVIRKRMIQTE